MADGSAYTLRVDRVTKRYGDHVAVSNLSFEVGRGSIYGLLGPNGSGKTTTLRMINDILAADEGEIRLLDGLSPGREASRRMGYLPEERGLYPKMRVLDVLQFFGELRGLRPKQARARACAWLERLGIADWQRNKVQDLSKGMQQKVQFVVALLHEPDFLILDEPWSGLDPINAEVLRDIVVEQRDAGKTILFSTHLMEQAEKVCDRVCIIAKGKLILEGELEAIRREASGDRLLAVGFGDEGATARARQSVLADESTVSSVRERRGYLEVELADGAASGELLAALVGAKLPIRRFEIVVPTLHQIFVDRVGEQEQPADA